MVMEVNADSQRGGVVGRRARYDFAKGTEA
jgi:hypothetical protein